MSDSLKWQRVELVIPYDPYQHEEPAQWDWQEVLDLVADPTLVSFGVPTTTKEQ